MSTSLLYHAFGVRGYQYISRTYVGGQFLAVEVLQCRLALESQVE